MSKQEIDYIECRFVTHVPSKNSDTPDVHLIKERIHYKDGTSVPNIRRLDNIKRPFWVTKQSKRNHKDKKEYECLDNVLMYECTQSELRNHVAKALDKPWSNEQLRQLSSSPYLYGSDITSNSIIKHKYQRKYPCNMSPYGVATFDVETDVIHGTNDIIMATVIFENHSFTAVDKKFLSGFSNPAEQFKSCANKYLADHIKEHNLKLDFYLAENVVDLLKAVFNQIHKWKPDFLAIWNMDFDIPKVLEACEKNNIDPRDILCDPEIPREFRICKYKQGPSKKVTASGQVKPINPSSRWHTLYLSASYYVIDAMCAYKQIRLSDQELPSYKLDYVLKKEDLGGKLNFKEAEKYTDLAWHQFMQEKFKMEYMVYNVFDSFSMLLLDAKTKDLCITLPSAAGTTAYDKFNSLPTRIADAFHYHILEDKNYVLGTVGTIVEKKEAVQDEDTADYDGSPDNEEDEEEELSTLNLKNWIITLAAHLSMLGDKFITEDPTMQTNIRTFAYDSDEVSAYPTATSVANVSKTTTKREIAKIEGIDEELFRRQNMNMVLGQTNANEYTQQMFGMPTPDKLLAAFRASL